MSKPIIISLIISLLILDGYESRRIKRQETDEADTSMVTCMNDEVCQECPSLLNDFSEGRISLSDLKSKHCGGKKKFCCPCPDDYDAPCYIPRFEDGCGTHTDLSKIIGGEDTKPGRYPFMALIGRYSTTNQAGDIVPEWTDHRCGGTIVNRWYVLTAAHCYPDYEIIDLEKEVVTIGEYLIGTELDCVVDSRGNKNCLNPLQILKLEKYINHEDYRKSKRKGILNDIALVKLQTMIGYNKFVRPVCLPLGFPEEFDFLRIRNYNEATVGIKGHVVGWGYTNKTTRKTATTQQKVDLPVLDSEKCFEQYKTLSKRVSFDDKFCAGEAGKSSCNGDSGGPMVINKFNKQNKELLTNNDESHWIQVGIVSFGPKQCDEPVSGVYTRVSSYIEWIKNNLK